MGLGRSALPSGGVAGGHWAAAPAPDRSPAARALIASVGAGRGPRRGRTAGLEWLRMDPEGAVEKLRAAAPDVILVDGALPARRLAQVLGGVAELPPAAAGRPTVLLVAPAGRRRRLPGGLAGAVDEVIGAELGQREILDRVQAALRTRSLLQELSRKNRELEGLYVRVDGMARRMADELRLASNVQRSLLPPPLRHPRLEVAREFLPFREIGGDYYDLVALGPQRLAVAIGDVMGKGVPAALLAANLKATLRAQLLAGEVTADELVVRVNRLFFEVTPKGRFASLFFGVLDLEQGRLTYVNAGHDYPFVIRRGGEVEDLHRGGTVLGLMEDAPYERGEVRIGKDDLLVFYSDGVTDREDASGELYGVERLKESAGRCRADDARIVLYTLLGEVQGWSGGRPAEDDVTLVVAKLR